ncbi:hypothetical protein [Lentzea sp.]|uniref:hypothetical protein n=1 Tax=Lentzea sp. TaxID=56099 RepID=UPI002ED654CE
MADNFKNASGGLVATGSGAGTTRADYEAWDWKQIKASIYGTAAVVSNASEDRLAGPANPLTLYDAALSFRATQELLYSIGKNVAAQAKALAGDNGPWSGEAAKSFLVMMDQFSRAFTNHADQLAGGPAKLNPVAEQLWRAANHLNWAQQTVHAIDLHYAEQARRNIGNRQDVIMPDGRVVIGKFPEIVAMMTADMRKVLKDLASDYEVMKFDTELAAPPTPKPLADVPKAPPGNRENPDLDRASIAPTKFAVPDLPPGLTQSPDLVSASIAPTRFAMPDSPPSSFQGPDPVSASIAPTKSAVPDLSPSSFQSTDPAPFNARGMVVDGGNAFTPTPFDASGTRSPGGANAFDPANLPSGSSFSPQPFNGTGVPNGISPMPFSPSAFTSSSGPGSSNGVNVPKPGSAAGTGLTPLQRASIAPFDGAKTPNASTTPPTGWAAGTAPQGLGLEDRPGAGMPGMPMMPPMAPGAGNGAGANGSERSDASGLIGGEIDPWKSAGVPAFGDPELGAAQLGGERERWSAVSPSGVPASGMPGMPMMPPMAPGAGSGAGANGSERSDASGLIGGEVAPWESAGVPAFGDPELGAAQLGGERERWSAAPPVVGESVGAPGVPMMPPMAPGAAAGVSGPERSDASGLIGAEVAPWEGLVPQGVGDPEIGASPGNEREYWAAPHQQRPGASGLGGDEIVTRGGVLAPLTPSGASTPANSPRGPRWTEASALVGGERAAWESGPVPGPADRDDEAVAVEAPLLPEFAVPQEVSAPGGAPAVALPGVPVESVTPAGDRVAVVRPADRGEDFAAWNTSGAVAVPVWAPRPAAQDEADGHAPDYALRESTPWAHATNHTAARSSVMATAATPAFSDESDLIPRIHFEDSGLPTCSGEEVDEDEERRRAEEQARAEEEAAAAEEEKERRSVELLKQEGAAWAAPVAPKRPGVID